MDEALVEGVLQLKPAERLRLLEAIHDSLERPDTGIDEVWYEEAKRRLAAFKAGKVGGIPGEEVLGDRP